MTPRVSIIIRTRNRADYLGAAVDSALTQTFTDRDVIVVDDGSRDSTPDLLAGYGSRLRTVRLDPARGPAAAFNAGVRAARGGFVAFLDSDDLWLPDKLERQLALLDRSERFGFAYGNVRLWLPDGTKSQPVLAPEQIISGSVLRAILRDMCVHTSTVVARRVWLDRIGPCPERYSLCEDYAWFLRLARVTDSVCAPEPVALIRRHEDQISVLGGLDTYRAAIAILTEFLADAALPTAVRREGRRTIARHHAHLAKTLAGAGELGPARRHNLQALRHDPFHRPAWRWTFGALTNRVG